MGADLLQENRHTDTDVTTLIVSLRNRANLINNIHILTGSENSFSFFFFIHKCRARTTVTSVYRAVYTATS